MGEPDSQAGKIDRAYLALLGALASGNPEAVRTADARVADVARESTPGEVRAWLARVNERHR